MAKVWCVYYRRNRWNGARPGRWLPMGKCTFHLLTGTARLVISAAPYRGLFIVERQTKSWRHDVPDGAVVWSRERLSVKKVKLSEKSAVKHLAALESEYFKDVMPVVDSLGMLQYDDGTPRQSGYLGIWTNGSAWVARITDKDADAHLTAEGRTVDEALDLLALLLGSDDAPWEPASRKKKKGS